MIRLYDLKKGAEIYGLEPDGDKDGIVVFDHLDGMYSYCYVKGHKDKAVHLSVITPLKRVGEHYMLEREEIDG